MPSWGTGRLLAIVLLVGCSDANVIPETVPPGPASVEKLPVADAGTTERPKSYRSTQEDWFFSGKEVKGPLRYLPCLEKGYLLEDAVEKVFKKNLRTLEACFRPSGTVVPTDREEFVIKAMVREDGVTQMVGIIEETDASESDQGVQRCLASAVRRWRYPKLTDGEIIFITYSLKVVFGATDRKPIEILGDPGFSWPKMARDGCEAYRERQTARP